MSYATAEELAAALHLRVTTANEAGLTACLDAAAAEIDHDCDWINPGGPTYEAGDQRLALLGRVNLARAVEWWKANDAAFGVIGFDAIGVLNAPRDQFARHALNLAPCKERWGLA